MTGPAPQDTTQIHPWTKAYVLAKRKGLSDKEAQAEADASYAGGPNDLPGVRPPASYGPLDEMIQGGTLGLGLRANAANRTIQQTGLDPRGQLEEPLASQPQGTMPPGGLGPLMNQNVGDLQNVQAQFRHDNPKTAFAANALGGVALNTILPGSGFLGKTKLIRGAADAAEGMGFVGGLGRRALVGGAEGALQGAVQGTADAPQGQALLGGTLGFVGGALGGAIGNAILAPLIQKAAGTGQTFLAKRYEQFAQALPADQAPGMPLVPNRAQDAAYHGLYKVFQDDIGANPQDLIPIIQSRNALIPEQAQWMGVADQFPTSLGLRNKLSEAVVSSGRAAKLVAEMMRTRVQGANLVTRPEAVAARVSNSLQKLYGDAVPERGALEAITANLRKNATDPLYNKLRADFTVVDDPQLRFVAGSPEGQIALEAGRREEVAKMAAFTKDASLLGKIRPIVVKDGQVQGNLTVSDILALRTGLSIRRSVPGATNRGEIDAMIHMVDDVAANTSPDLAVATMRYRQSSEMMNAVEIAMKGIKGKSGAEIGAELKDFTTPAAKRVYQGAAIREIMEQVKSSSDPVKYLDNPKVKEQVAAIFADQPEIAVQLYQTALGAEVAMQQSNPIANLLSKAHEAQVQGKALEARSTAKAQFQVPVIGAILRYTEHVRSQLAEDVAYETARAMTSTGQDLFQMLRMLKAPPPPNLLGGQIGGRAGAYGATQVGTTYTERKP